LPAITQTFENFAAALAACGPGYGDGDLADVIAHKTSMVISRRQIEQEQAVNSILAVSFCAAEVAHRPLNVLDFGGGCGFHYFRAAQAMQVPLRWAVVETPTMAERAARLANDRFDAFTTIAEAAEALGRIDLVHASSVIQYVPNPLATLKTLADLRPRFFALLRFPVWDSPLVVGLQRSRLSENGIGPMPPHISDRQIAYPVTFPNFDEATQVLSDYEIAILMASPSSNYELKGRSVPGASLIFRAKNVGATGDV
jgi:putative methyltransferase (TIGR04325 family)